MVHGSASAFQGLTASDRIALQQLPNEYLKHRKIRMST
eukprot:IDg6193t1